MIVVVSRIFCLLMCLFCTSPAFALLRLALLAKEGNEKWYLIIE